MRIEEDRMRSYVMHVLLWKQSRELIREYTTVLHMHKSDLASMLESGLGTIHVYTDP